MVGWVTDQLILGTNKMEMALLRRNPIQNEVCVGGGGDHEPQTLAGQRLPNRQFEPRPL